MIFYLKHGDQGVEVGLAEFVFGPTSTLEDFAMRRKVLWKTTIGFAALVLFSGNFLAASAQTRPEAPPFDASRITMQPPPPEGVAVRAGRLFDPRTGTNLTNQVIVIQGDRISDV